MNESDYDPDDPDFDHALSEHNWLSQTRGRFMKYIIYIFLHVCHSFYQAYLPFVVNTLCMITQSHCYNQTSFDDCVELWVISVLEISCAFPLIAVDINELAYLCSTKRAFYRPCYS